MVCYEILILIFENVDWKYLFFEINSSSIVSNFSFSTISAYRLFICFGEYAFLVVRANVFSYSSFWVFGLRYSSLPHSLSDQLSDGFFHAFLPVFPRYIFSFFLNLISSSLSFSFFMQTLHAFYTRCGNPPRKHFYLFFFLLARILVETVEEEKFHNINKSNLKVNPIENSQIQEFSTA